MNIVYGAILSPFVRKVLMVLEHKGIEYQSELVLPFANKPSFAAKSPLRKIPAYEDEYVTLADSTVICDYLNNKYPQSSLYPRSPVERAQALWFEEYADTVMQQHLGPGIFFERVVTPGMYKRASDEEKVQRNIAAMPPILDYLEGQMNGTAFLVGGELSIADIAVGCVLLNGQYAGFYVDGHRWPQLSSYLKALFQHPLFVKRIEQERPVLEGMLAKASEVNG